MNPVAAGISAALLAKLVRPEDELLAQVARANAKREPRSTFWARLRAWLRS